MKRKIAWAILGTVGAVILGGLQLAMLFSDGWGLLLAVDASVAVLFAVFWSLQTVMDEGEF